MTALPLRPLLGALALGLATAAAAEPLIGLTTTNSLLGFDSASPGTISSVSITGLQAGEQILGIDFRPATQTLYGLGSSNRLYSLNTMTGAATQMGSAGAFTLSGTAFGFDFNPTVDRIRVTSNTGQNLRLNPNDGTLAATDSGLGFAVGDANAGTAPRVVGSAYTNSFAGATTTTLYAIDSNLDILATQIPPNNGTLNTLGPLGFNTADLVGFDISPLSGLSFASLTAPGGASSQLFAINLATGGATLIGSIGGAVALADLATAAPIPEPETYALMLGGLLAVSAAARRAKRRSA